MQYLKDEKQKCKGVKIGMALWKYSDRYKEMK